MCTRISSEDSSIDEIQQSNSETDAIKATEGCSSEPSVNDVLDAIVPTGLNAVRHSISLPATSVRHSPFRARASVDIERGVEADRVVDGSWLQKVDVHCFRIE